MFVSSLQQMLYEVPLYFTQFPAFRLTMSKFLVLLEFLGVHFLLVAVIPLSQ
jgi:hypothetical protein